MPTLIKDATAVVRAAIAAALVAPLSALASDKAPPAQVAFGASDLHPPYEWQSASGPRGFNVELIRAIADHVGVEARINLAPWPQTVTALRRGQIDIAALPRTQRLAGEFRLSEPIVHMDLAAYGPPGADPVRNGDDLVGKRVAVLAGGYSAQRVATLDDTVRVHAVATLEAAARAVVNGRADYALLSRASVHHTGLLDDFAVEADGPALWSAPYVFAVRSDRPALARWIGQELDRALATGVYAQVYQRWEDDLEADSTTWGEALVDAAFVLGPLAALAVAGLGWSWALRRRVAERTRHLDAELQRRAVAERQARHLAEHDKQTGLPNRERFIRDLADRTGTHAQAYDLMVLSLSQLHDVTRTFGHDMGAAAVRSFAERVRSLDAQAIGYFGGNTFAASVRAGEGETATECLSQPVAVGDLDIDLVVVAGIARFPADGADVSELLRRAETALAATVAGRVPVCRYAPSMEPDRDDLWLVRDFRRAGGADIELALQPQISLARGALVGAEALVRWTHPQLGPVSPARFVPLLERAGQIGSLTRLMVDRAAATSAALRSAGQVCTVSVNISAHDLLHIPLVDEFESALARHGGRATDLVVELTETSLAVDALRVAEGLRALKQLGVSVAIDDFGTGYASLAYITEFPIDEIKIDRLFIANMLVEPRYAAVVNSTLTMASEMGLRVVAEGIEDAATLNTLSSRGCHTGQGYCIAAPMPFNELLDFAAAGILHETGTTNE